jgi:hypothetical protein
MKKRTLGLIFQIPVWILLLVIFISFFYLWFTGGYAGMSGGQFFRYGLPIWIIIILYVIGRVLENKKDNPF